jgi:hypothetical protein
MRGFTSILRAIRAEKKHESFHAFTTLTIRTPAIVLSVFEAEKFSFQPFLVRFFNFFFEIFVDQSRNNRKPRLVWF